MVVAGIDGVSRRVGESGLSQVAFAEYRVRKASPAKSGVAKEGVLEIRFLDLAVDERRALHAYVAKVAENQLTLPERYVEDGLVALKEAEPDYLASNELNVDEPRPLVEHVADVAVDESRLLDSASLKVRLREVAMLKDRERDVLVLKPRLGQVEILELAGIKLVAREYIGHNLLHNPLKKPLKHLVDSFDRVIDDPVFLYELGLQAR